MHAQFRVAMHFGSKKGFSSSSHTKMDLAKLLNSRAPSKAPKSQKRGVPKQGKRNGVAMKRCLKKPSMKRPASKEEVPSEPDVQVIMPLECH